MSLPLKRPLIDQITDVNVRQSFQWLFDYLQASVLLTSNFSHFELTFNKAETELIMPHGLGFAPLDIIITSTTGAGVASFSYEKFDTRNLVLSTTGACVIRFLAGRYKVL